MPEALKIVICFAFLYLSVEGAKPTAVKAAYWPSTKLQRLLRPSAINTSLFTHVYYGFVMPNKESLTFDQLPESTTSLLSLFTSSLQKNTPRVRTILSIGDGDKDNELFTKIASDIPSTNIFVDSTIRLARKFGFDGLDLNWQFPKDATQMKYFATLITHWRRMIEWDAQAMSQPPLLLTAIVYYSSEFKNNGDQLSFPVKDILKSLDWINVKCFDYQKPRDTSTTGAHAALFEPKTNVSSFMGLWSWVHAGVPSNKLVMGIPLYGRSWILKDPNQHDIGAPTVGAGPGFDDGIVTYGQVDEFNHLPGVTIVYDKTTISAYSYLNTTWIGYDNEISTKAKVEFAQSLNLGGYFFWALSYDSADWKLSTQASNAWVDGH